MNKGIPYLLAVLVALTLSAGWTAPVLALFEQAVTCLHNGGALDLVRMRCQASPSGLCTLLGAWPFWTTAAVVAAAAIAAARSSGGSSQQMPARN